MSHPHPVPAQPVMPAPQQEAMWLIADVAALTGVPPPQLRSWEAAGLLHPRRSPKGTRLYEIDEVARVRLIKRSLRNPGRRGSLRRLAAQLASGTVLPAPEDYAGLATTPVPMSDAAYWQAVVEAQVELVVVCETSGRVTSMNPALRALLPDGEGMADSAQPARSPTGEPLPAALEALPLRWSALTGTRHRDVELVLPGPAGVEHRTLWNVIPLRDDGGALLGTVGVGREVPLDASVQREDSLVMAAHDLRGPVTTILGRLELARRTLNTLRGGSADPVEQESTERLDHHLAVAELSTFDLVHTMDTLLDASAAAHGALIQQMEPGGVALDLLAQQAVERAQGHSKRHLLTLEVSAAPLLVVGDRVRLRQVLDNLLSNATKYAPDGGPISVRLEAVATLPMLPPDLPLSRQAAAPDGLHWAVVRVTDTGLGIPASAIPHVFDRYWRADGVMHHIRGSGLGLYTCRAIVAAHGGHIWVERSVPAPERGATADGWHGTVMALVLPLAVPPEPLDVERGSVAEVRDTATD